MIEMYIAVAVALVIAGAAVGALAVVCLGIRRDDRSGRFPAATDDPIARAARKATGAAARGTGLAAKAGRPPDSLPA